MTLPPAPRETSASDGVSSSSSLVLFRLDEQRFALRLSSVERVLPMVEITPLPRSPDIVVGVINLAGQIVSVLDIRARFELAPHTPGVNDYLLVAHTRAKSVAFIVDEVPGVMDVAPINSADRDRDGPYVAGVARLEDGLVLIHDLDTFLSAAERDSLESALAAARTP